MRAPSGKRRESICIYVCVISYNARLSLHGIVGIVSFGVVDASSTGAVGYEYHVLHLKISLWHVTLGCHQGFSINLYQKHVIPWGAPFFFFITKSQLAKSLDS